MQHQLTGLFSKVLQTLEKVIKMKKTFDLILTVGTMAMVPPILLNIGLKPHHPTL
jgi:hypothetical protein